jgi:hypothetical protein
VARPKRKHIVTPSWVTECVEEETLMNEDGEWRLSWNWIEYYSHLVVDDL